MANWKVISRPPRGSKQTRAADWRAFYANLLLPGFSIGFHAVALGVHRLTITRYLQEANAASRNDPDLRQLVADKLTALTPEDGLAIARCRGERAHLSYWSRMAMQEFRKRGQSAAALAEMFRCSISAVHRAVAGKRTGFDCLSAQRHLPLNQLHPPGKRAAWFTKTPSETPVSLGRTLS